MSEMLGELPMVGACAARLKRIAARAWRRFASAIFRFWLDESTWSSISFNVASPYSSHHFPRIRSSSGCATFHPSPSFDSCVSSKFGVIGTVGLTYLGPTMQPDRRNPTALTRTTPKRLIVLLHWRAWRPAVQRLHLQASRRGSQLRYRAL